MTEASGIGKQLRGKSGDPIYDMAMRCFGEWDLAKGALVADIGGGRGNFAQRLHATGFTVEIVDHERAEIDFEAEYLERDLNLDWGLAPGRYDAIAALEVIEHLENPRHFMRQVVAMLKPGAHAIVTTPNNLNLASKLCLVLRGQFREFQEERYPSHITALVRDDLRHIVEEAGAEVVRFVYSGAGRIPFSNRTWPRGLAARGSLFSDNIGVVLRKPSA